MNTDHQDYFFSQLKIMRIGIGFALFTLLYGFGLGGIFGAFEDDLKGHLKSSALAVSESVYQNDEAKMAAVLDKSWTYFKRAHLHANGIGTAATALSILLIFLSISARLKSILSAALGIGALGYSSFWMFAALKAPGMGSTGAAKESLSFLAFPSAFLCISGVAIVLGLLLLKVFGSKQ